MNFLLRSALRLALATGTAATVCSLSGCAVVTVAGTAASLAASGAGLAADAAVGTVRLTGKALGAAANLAIPDSSNE